MMQVIVPAALGVLCIILGILNMRGNISSLHSYHRHRVAQEDRLPFGRLVGLGTIVIGVSIIFFSAMSFLAELLEIPIITIIGTAVMIIGLAVGLGLSIYAMIKYNKGIF